MIELDPAECALVSGGNGGDLTGSGGTEDTTLDGGIGMGGGGKDGGFGMGSGGKDGIGMGSGG
jgi:hypothetical protein